MKTIEYFMIPSSPWTYLGHARLSEIAKNGNARIVMKPFDLGRVFPLSGGLPLPKRAPQRQHYRLAELARWRDFLNVPLTIEPKHFPVPADAAMQMIAATIRHESQEAAFTLAGSIMKAVWADEQDISNATTLENIAKSQGLDTDALSGLATDAAQDVERKTDEAIELQVFGSPWYRIDGQSFWGQDRLDFVERALS